MSYALNEYANAIKKELRVLIKADVNFFIYEDKIFIDSCFTNNIYYRHIIPDAWNKMLSGVSSKTIAQDMVFHMKKYIEKMFFN